jgi:hypothetical protein
MVDSHGAELLFGSETKKNVKKEGEDYLSI